MELKPCPKHDRQETLDVQGTYTSKGYHFFQMKCPVCHKLGEKRKTIHGAEMAWNKANTKENT